jgi:hypothetical protein
VATHHRLQGVSGKYFADCNEALPSSPATNTQEAKRLWLMSELLVSSPLAVRLDHSVASVRLCQDNSLDNPAVGG